jgi:hypothetical protein
MIVIGEEGAHYDEEEDRLTTTWHVGCPYPINCHRRRKVEMVKLERRKSLSNLKDENGKEIDFMEAKNVLRVL